MPAARDGPKEEASMSSEDGESPLQRHHSRPSFEPLLSGGESSEDDDDCDDGGAVVRERWWSTLVAGGLAGAVSRTSVAPLERLKILFQVQGLSARGAPLRHVGIVDSLRDLVAKDGVLGLWRGNGLNCVRVVPSSAIQFFSYTKYKEVLFLWAGKTEEHLTAIEHMVAGGLAGATSTTLTYPLDLLRARRTVDFRGDVPVGVVSGIRNILREEGFRGLFRGLTPSLCGIIPYIGIDFALFDMGKRYCRTHGIGLNQRGDITPFTKVGCGAAAGVCGMTVAYPFDTLRRNLQVATLKMRGEHETRRPMTMLGVLRAVLANGGVTALYRGLLPNYLKAGPSVGISFATFEAAKQLFDEQP